MSNKRVLSGRYRLKEVIGTGGMSIVYRAWDQKEHQEVAVKLLRPEFEMDAEFVRRFNHEAQAAAKMSHENIVGLYDVGVDNGVHYIVLEYVKGQTLKELIRQVGRIKPQRAVQMALRILAAVDHAHKNGIIHRDIKPQNILLDRYGTIKVSDFGIARMADAQTMTADTSVALGSVHYFSPEQASGKVADEKSDLYSVGVVVYEMLTGRVPFDGDTSVSVALKHVNDEPTSMCIICPDISKGLDEVVQKSLAKDPAKRYQTAAEMAADLKRALRMPEGGFVVYPPTDAASVFAREEGKSNRKHTPKWKKRMILIACLVLAIAMVLGGFWMRRMLYSVDVPNVAGYTETIAVQMIQGFELKPTIERAYASDSEVGMVIGQEPASGTSVQRGDPIKLIVSLGEEPIELPDVTGLNYDDAETLLITSGFYHIGQVYTQGTAENENLVVAQSPPAGLAQASETVTLTVSIEGTTVPVLTGLTPEAARQMLSDYGLVLGEVTEAYSEDAAANTVIAQSVPSGTLVSRNSTVNVTLSLSTPATYYATYVLNVPLKMDVRVVQVSPSGVQKEIVNEALDTGVHTYDLSSAESGAHKLWVYYDGDLYETATVTFE